MRILVHDHSGHPFQAELSRALARRGHQVTHSFTAGYVSGKGALAAAPGETLVFEGIGGTRPIDNLDFGRRLPRELARGVALYRQARRVRADVTLVSNAQIPTLVVFAFLMMLVRRPWVLWHQDVYAIAVKSFAGEKLGRSFRLVAAIFTLAERWCARRARAVVVIADSFVPVHAEWGTADKVSVIPNWAPVDEIRPVERDNAWAREHELLDKPVLLYSGTLGLKHNPGLLVELTRAVRDQDMPAELVVVNEGPAGEVLRDEAKRLDVPLTLLPFQPFERLSEVLGTGDVLVVLLDQAAGAFSVPSKTLSYLCVGRPILGLMPSDNLAAGLIEETGGHVLPPEDAVIADAAKWVVGVLSEPGEGTAIGRRARALAEREFSLETITDRFEQLLSAAR